MERRESRGLFSRIVNSMPAKITAGVSLIYSFVVIPLDWASRVEYAKQKISEGIVEAALIFIASPPPWFLLLLIVFGFLVLLAPQILPDQSLPPVRSAGERYEQNDEREFERGFYKAVLKHNANLESTLHLLTRLRSEGVALRNNVPTYLFPDDLAAWIGKLNDWMNEVIEAIKAISTAEAEMFGTLDTVPPARVPIPNIRLGSKEDRAAFEHQFRMHDLRLAKLQTFLNKHGIG